MSSGVPGAFDGDHDALLAQFIGAHNVDPEEATRWLSLSNWDLSAASVAYQAHEDENEAGSDDGEEEETADRRGGRTLAGGPVPQPVETRSGAGPSTGAKSSGATGKKIATLGDLGSSQAPEDHDDDSDDDHDLFTGGEKSGLAVQNPDDLKRKILEKARKGGARPGGDDPRAGPSNFRGAARTLGGDEEPSRVVEDPDADVPQAQPRVERRLHFWSNGFSVDDGDLYDIQDPQNAHILQMIRQGRAPLDIMNVSRDQEVDVKVEQHEGPYEAPKKKANPFSGSGQRLGSPTPGHLTGTSSPARAAPMAPASTTPATASGAAPTVDLDNAQPTVAIQIRLGDGTRLVSRFNLSHTVGDIYAFVDASSAASAARPYALMTTFPSKDLTDREIAIGDTEELKKGGAVVQKWL